MSADPRYLHFPIEVLQDNTNEPEAAYQISTKIESSRKLESSYKSLEDLGQRRQRINIARIANAVQVTIRLLVSTIVY